MTVTIVVVLIADFFFEYRERFKTYQLAAFGTLAALIPIITSAGSYLPYVFLGSLVFESFFGIPGLGAFVIEAISGQDFAIVRTMVFLGAVLYIATNALIDIAYTWVDPRVRLA